MHWKAGFFLPSGSEFAFRLAGAALAPALAPALAGPGALTGDSVVARRRTAATA